MESLDDKVVLLTGASQGIGAATARILGRAGASLGAHHRGSADDLEGARSALSEVPSARKHFVGGDFEDNTAVERVWQEAQSWVPPGWEGNSWVSKVWTVKLSG